MSSSASKVQETNQHLMQDAIGAEFVAAVDATEVMGTRFEFVERVFKIAADQVQFLKDDYAETGRALRSGQPSITTVSGHIQRRATHQFEGWNRYYQALMAEQTRLFDLHVSIWRPFLCMVNKDLYSRPD